MPSVTVWPSDYADRILQLDQYVSPLSFLSRRPLERRDFEWGGEAWTRPILPQRFNVRVEFGSMVPAGMGALLDGIEWRWPDA